MTTLQETKTNKSDLDLRIYHDALKYYKTKLHKCFEGGGCKWFGNGCKHGNSFDTLKNAAIVAALNAKQKKMFNNVRISSCYGEEDGISCPYPGGPQSCWD